MKEPRGGLCVVENSGRTTVRMHRWYLWLVLMRAGSFDSTLRFSGPHEGMPDKAGLQIFSHQRDDAGVDSNHVGVVPVFEGIECVDETVPGPGRRVAAADCL